MSFKIFAGIYQKAYGNLAGPNDSDEELQPEDGDEVRYFSLKQLLDSIPPRMMAARN